MQIPSSILNNVNIKLERYDAANSRIKQADLERDGDKVVPNTNSEFRDVFIRSDVPENEKATIYEGERPDYFTAEYAGRLVKSMSNEELYEILAGHKTGYVTPNICGKSVAQIIKTGGGDDCIEVGGYYVHISTVSNQQFAEYLSGIGKRIDQAYAEGKFTEEEYNFLNNSYDEYVEEVTVGYQRAKAVKEIAYMRGNNFEERMKFINERSGMTLEEALEAFQKEIDDYVEKYTKVDRNWLYDMINRLRYGAGTLLK